MDLFKLDLWLSRALPDSISRRLAKPYNWLRSRRADEQFREKRIPARRPSTDAPHHVVLCVIDALRADQINPEITPYLDTLPGTNAISTSTWTFPAVTSIITGKYPHEHGSIRQTDSSDDAANHDTLPPKLSNDVETLPELFASAGYETYASFGNIMPFLSISGRFRRHDLHIQASADQIIDRYRKWISRRAEQNTFAYLHFSDMHIPIDPPDYYWDKFDIDRSIENLTRWNYTDTLQYDDTINQYRTNRRRLYQATANYVDDALKKLHEKVEDTFEDDYLLLVTSDHGEALWEHSDLDAEHFTDSRPAYGVKHGGTPFEELARVPLIVSGTHDFEADLEPPISLIDICPTLANQIGCGDAFETSGRPFDGSASDTDRILLVESVRYGYERKASYIDDWKIIVSKGDQAEIGFRLPGEEPVELPDDVYARLTEAFPPWPDENGDGTDQAISGMTRSQLEDLGYI